MNADSIHRIGVWPQIFAEQRGSRSQPQRAQGNTGELLLPQIFAEERRSIRKHPVGL